MSNHVNTRKRKNDSWSDGPLRKRPRLRLKLSKNRSNNYKSVSTAQAVEALTPLLLKMEEPQHVSCGGSVSFPSISGLCVDGIGSVSLPLCNERISKLFSIYAQSPNDDHIALEHSRFHLSHPKWNENIQQLIQSSLISLGINYQHIHLIETHVNKLFVTRNNACFTNNPSTAEHKGAFATLMVQLPSQYTVDDDAAALVIQHKYKSYPYYCGTKDGYAPFNIFYAAFYNQVQITHNQIAKGYRTCIMYDIYWKGSMDKIPSIHRTKALKLQMEQILQSWKADECIGIALKHQYDALQLKRIGLFALKEVDFVIYIVKIDKFEDVVSHTWLTVDGDAFDFGEYIQLNVRKQCVCYETHQDGDTVSDNNSNYVKNDNRWIMVAINECLTFQIILKHNASGAILWIQEAINRDPGKDILDEITQIVEQSIDVSLAINHGDTLSILEILLEKAHYELFIRVVDHHLVSKRIGYHGFYYDYHTLAFYQIIAIAIADYGWVEPLRSCVLRLVDCIQCGDIETVKHYCDFMHILEKETFVSFDNLRRASLISGYVRSQVTKERFCFVPLDILNIIEDNYGEDCCKEIADTIWPHIYTICTNLNPILQNGPYVIDAYTILSIWRFIILYQWNPQKQKQMSDFFDEIYEEKLDSMEIHEESIEVLVKYLTGHKDDAYFDEIVKLLLDKFDVFCSYASHVIHQILELLNVDQFIQFMDTKLIKFIGNRDINTIASIDYFTHEHQLICGDIANVVVSNEWQGNLKSVILRWIHALIALSRDVTDGITQIELFMEQITNKCTKRTDINVIVDYDACLKDVIMAFWKGIISLSLANLSNSDVMIIIHFIFSSCDPNDKQQQEMYKIFDTLCYTQIPQSAQQEIISIITASISSSSILSYESVCIQNILRHRIRYLNNLEEPKEFTWIMMQEPTSTQMDSDFIEFLKSNTSTFIQTGFKSIKDARNWKKQMEAIAISTMQFSANFLAEGRGAKAYVTVTKTDAYFNSRRVWYQERVSELRNLLQHLRSV